MGRKLSPRQIDAEHVRMRRERLARYRADYADHQARWIAICDGQTCEQCAAMHGRVIALDDPSWTTLLRLHDGCRCRFTLNM